MSKEKQIEDVYKLYKTYKQKYDELVAMIQKTRFYHLETDGSYSVITMQDRVRELWKMVEMPARPKPLTGKALQDHIDNKYWID